MKGIEILINWKGMNQVQVAKELGITKQTLNGYLKDNTLPDKHVKSICKIFNVDEEIFDREILCGEIPEKERAKLDKYLDGKSLTEDLPMLKKIFPSVVIQSTGIGKDTVGKEAEKHYNNTVNNFIELNNIKKYITNDEYKELLDIYPSGKVKLWGIREGKSDVNSKTWDKLEIGDIVYFIGNKKVIKSACIVYKMKNDKLANSIWGSYENKTWEYIYFINEAKDLDINFNVICEIVGYSSNYIPRGITILDKDKSLSLIEYYDIESKVYGHNVSDDEYKKLIESMENANSLDRSGKVKTRLEQKLLRKYLFNDKKVAKCAICGQEYPIELLITAHIKKRCMCTNEERLDYKNIAVPMCVFGCDSLYEKGFIGVNNGVIKKIKDTECTSVEEYIKKIEDKKCASYTEDNAKYFEQHFKMNRI